MDGMNNQYGGQQGPNNNGYNQQNYNNNQQQQQNYNNMNQQNFNGMNQQYDNMGQQQKTDYNMNQQNYNNINQQNYNNINQQQYNPYGSTPGFALWCILGVIQTLCCCNFTGIGVIILSVIAHVSFKDRNYNNYQWQIKAAKIVFFVGIGLQLVGMILGLTTGIFESLFS